jgi:hypothetical protein
VLISLFKERRFSYKVVFVFCWFVTNCFSFPVKKVQSKDSSVLWHMSLFEEEEKVLKPFKRSLSEAQELNIITVSEYNQLVQLIFSKYLILNSEEIEYKDREKELYWNRMDELLNILDKYFQNNLLWEEQLLNQCVLLCCIFCSKHDLSCHSVRESAAKFLNRICNGVEQQVLLSKKLLPILSYLSPIFKDTNAKNRIDPLWKCNPWVKYTLEWLILQIHHPYLNGENVLQLLLPMVLKLADDFMDENKRIGLDLLIHMLRECNRIQLVMGYDQYIFPVIRTAIGTMRENVQLLSNSMKAMNLFLQLHSGCDPAAKSLLSGNNVYTYKKPTQFFEDAINEYLSCAEYAQSNEQKMVIIENLAELLPVMSIGYVKHIRRMFKILFSNEYLSIDIEKPKKLVDTCLYLCKILFTSAWPIISRYNEKEKAFMKQTLTKIKDSNEGASHVLELLIQIS